jgi:hypothetical protein
MRTILFDSRLISDCPPDKRVFSKNFVEKLKDLIDFKSLWTVCPKGPDYLPTAEN